MRISCLAPSSFGPQESLETLRESLLAALETGDVSLDCSHVSEVSLEGIQLLWAAVQSAEQQQYHTKIIPSDALWQGLRKAGCTQTFRPYLVEKGDSHG